MQALIVILERLGHVGLAVALPAAAYAGAALGAGCRLRSPRLLASGRRAVAATAALLTLAMLGLWAGFLGNDLSLAYVAEHSDRAMPLLYKLTAPWGGDEGSLLFWAWILSVYALLALRARDPEAEPYKPYALTVLSAVAVFFVGLLNFVASPFVRLPQAPPHGQGLNPLLQDPYMAIHPPMLYAGFVGFSVPFAFAMSALLLRRPGVAWIRVTRRWSLLAFFFLSTGILLGGHWAYHMLGWGGYWAWDPVENASFLPWLAGTAFIHSSMIEERRGMLKTWNMGLVTLAFALTIFGTFLTRSGIVNSVHAFANSGLGPYFVGFLGAIVLFAGWLTWDRAPLLRPERELESAVSKESAFLFNNALFLGAVFAVLWGTVYPIVTEAVIGQRISVGPPFFAAVFVPIALAILILMGVGPLIAWRRASPRGLWRSFAAPVLFAASILLVAGLLGVRRPVALLAFAICAFALATVVVDAARALSVRRQITGDPAWLSAWRLVTRHRHRYGGYLVHVAVAVIAIGMIGSNAYRIKAQRTLRPGQRAAVGGFGLAYRGLAQRPVPGGREVYADLGVTRDGRPYGSIAPAVVTFAADPSEPVARVGLISNLEGDLYVVLAGATSAQATFEVYVNPLVDWIWIGQVLLMVGTLWAMWPERGRALAVRTHPEPREEGAPAPAPLPGASVAAAALGPSAAGAALLPGRAEMAASAPAPPPAGTEPPDAGPAGADRGRASGRARLEGAG